MSDPEILRALEIRFSRPQTISELQEFASKCNHADDELLLGIFLQETMFHIGNIKLGAINSNHNRGELGFIIGEKSAWHKGYATEAISAVASYGLNDLGLFKIIAGCYSSNPGSSQALRNAGFQLEAVLKNHWVVDGRREDGLLFQISQPS
jgi:RimJ/RimL family protein N-acetyltransferase